MKDMTKGFPAKIIFLFAIPLMLGNIAQQIYSITDSKIVSLYVNSDALAAVGSTVVISNLLVGFLNGLTQGFGIVIARLFGAKDFKNLRKHIGGTFALTAVFAIAFTAIGVATVRPVLRLLRTRESIFDDAASYLTIIMWGIVFTAIYNMSANILRAVGDSKRPLYCLVVAIVCNIGLDFLFVKYFKWGIKGAAYATIIAQACCAISALSILVIKAKDLIPTKDEKLEKSGYKELLIYGFAMGLMGSIVNVGTIVLQFGINELGITVVTAHTASRRILDILMVLVYTIGVSLTTFVSQNFGAGRFDRIKSGVRQSIMMTSAITTAIIAFTFAFSNVLVGWVASSDNPEIIANGNMYLRIAVVCFYMLGPLFIFRCSMQGMGSSVIPLVTSFLEMLIKILSVIFLVPRLKYLGVALTEPISWFVMTAVLLVGYIVLIRKIERNNNVDSQDVKETIIE